MLSFFQNCSKISEFMLGLFSNLGQISFASIQNFFIFVAIAALPIIFALGKFSRTKPLFEKLYGQIEEKAFNKFMLLALCFLLLIASYWMVRVIKDALLKELVGFRQWAPVAKMLSAVTTMIALFIFNKFVYKVRQHRLFLAVGGVYAIVFLVLSAMYYFKLSIVGWLYYFTAESMGSLLVPAVFWGFVVSTSTTRHAKIGFPIIYIAGQCGNVLGPTVLTKMLKSFGYLEIMVLAVVPLILIPIVIESLVAITPREFLVSDQPKDHHSGPRPKTGMFEGLRLIFTKPYLMGVLAIATLYEVVATILEWMYKSQGEAISNMGANQTDFGIFVAHYAQILGMVSLTFAIFGTSFLIRRLGVRWCLILYPLISAICVIGTAGNPSLAMLLFVTVTVKGLSYALNNPLKELLYLPTSQDIKYKAKGFIDGLGSRASKAFGSAITGTVAKFGSTAGASFIVANLASIIALSIIGVWAVAAVLIGIRYNELVKKNDLIE